MSLIIIDNINKHSKTCLDYINITHIIYLISFDLLDGFKKKENKSCEGDFKHYNLRLMTVNLTYMCIVQKCEHVILRTVVLAYHKIIYIKESELLSYIV